MNLNSPFVQWLLKVGMSKAGPYIAAASAWLGVHVITWLGLAAFVPADQVAKIQNGISSGVEMIALSLMASAYAWLVHRQSVAVKIFKTQLDSAPVPTPQLDLQSGAVGDATLAAAARITGVSVVEAAQTAGVKLKP
jgi:hypothetical protein